MKVTIGSVAHVYGTVEWIGGEYRYSGQDAKLLSTWIPKIGQRLGLWGEALLQALPGYFGGADKWVKREQ